MPLPRANFVIIGQSNGGFYGNAAWPTQTPNVVSYNFREPNPSLRFQSYADPLPYWAIPSGSGTGGSIWSRLGFILKAQPTQIWGQICFAPIVEYGSPSSSWAPGGPCYPRIAETHNALKSVGLEPTAYLWLNGETDGASDRPVGSHYNNVISMIQGMRFAGISTPVFVAGITQCHLHGSGGQPAGPNFELLHPSQRLARWRWQERVQAEQRALQLRADKGIYAGANTDAIRGRHDGCHLNSIGQDAAALRWLEVILRAKANGKIQ